MPPDECPDVMGRHDPIHKLNEQVYDPKYRTPLHERFRTFPALPKPIRSPNYNVDDVRHEQVCERLDRIIALLEAKPGMAAQRWDMP